MSSPDLSLLTRQLTSKDLFEAFKTQLTKDFQQSNFSTDFVPGLTPDFQLIKEKIAGELYGSQAKSNANLMQLLYRIDISEGQLKKYLQHHENEDTHHVIAELIIKRVLQKVVIKKFYKEQGNGAE